MSSCALSLVRESLCSQSSDFFCYTCELLFGNKDEWDGADNEDMFFGLFVQLRSFFFHLLLGQVIVLNQWLMSRPKSFFEFMRKRLLSRALPLKCCVSILCTHVPWHLILEQPISVFMWSIWIISRDVVIVMFSWDNILEMIQILLRQHVSCAHKNGFNNDTFHEMIQIPRH